MSTLRTYNLQNPDSASVNIELTSDGGAVSSGILTATTLNATTISGVSTIGVTTATVTTLTVNGNNYPSAGPLSNRNLVHNGAMTVSQRTTSSSSLTSGNNFILDRWRTYIQDIGTYTISQASDAPAGFRYSYKVDCTTADASPSAADDMVFSCPFEGQDFQHLKKGTASAESVTLSFWIKSNKTTTGQVNFRDQDNSRMISGTYTINSADTWEYKTITFVGDTSGVLDNDNEASIQLQWYLDSGSNFTSGSINSSWGSDTAANRNVNNFGLASSTDNYWQITGVQLEVGTVATPFEHRSYGEELALCQRYCQRLGPDDGTNSLHYNSIASGWLRSGSIVSYSLQTQTDLPVRMRTIPTASVGGGTNTFYAQYGSTGITCSFSNLNIQGSSPQKVWLDFQPSSTAGTDGLRAIVSSDNSSGGTGQTNYIILSAEL